MWKKDGHGAAIVPQLWCGRMGLTTAKYCGSKFGEPNSTNGQWILPYRCKFGGQISGQISGQICARYVGVTSGLFANDMKVGSKPAASLRSALATKLTATRLESDAR